MIFRKIFSISLILSILVGCGGGGFNQSQVQSKIPQEESSVSNPPQNPTNPATDELNTTNSNQPQPTNTPPQIKTVALPLYSYPTTYKEEYENLYQIQTEKQILVILNPSNGAGEKKDQNFVDVITKLKQKGYSVFGYIYSNNALRDINQVKHNIDNYNQFYPDLDGFFIDEVNNNLSSYDYYREIYHYAKSYNKQIILNPGTTVPQEFYDIADFIVVFERDYNFLKTRYNFPQKITDKDCFLVYGVDSYQEAVETKNYLLNKGANCIYIIDENPPTWFKISPYLNLLLE